MNGLPPAIKPPAIKPKVILVMLRRLYDRVLALAAGPRAPLWLAVISFAESSFFPIPPDALLVPMALARPERAWRLVVAPAAK